jgi:C_GCAxxG_C_C family probable redox protein
MLTDEYVSKKFGEGIDCSMLVLAEFAEELGITREEAYRAASCFGAGMLTGGVCGAVTGAFIAIGYKHGNHKLNDHMQKMIVTSKRDEFVERFRKVHGSVDCPAILGADLRVPKEQEYARSSGFIDSKCPAFCRTAAQILKEIL